MKNDSKKPAQPQLLSGWKDIANYLGKGVRTVQRYEQTLGLPVRRPLQKPRGLVIATKVEIDAWVQATPIRTEFQLVKPATDPATPAVVAIRKSVAEMHKLNKEMAILRDELHTSCHHVHETVSRLQKELEEKQRIHSSTVNAPKRVLTN